MKIDLTYISLKKEPLLQKLLAGVMLTEKEQGQLEILNTIEKDIQKWKL